MGQIHSSSVSMTVSGIPLNGQLSDYNTESLTMDCSHGSNSHSSSVGMTYRGIPLNGQLSDYNTESLTMDYSHGSNSHSSSVGMTERNSSQWAVVRLQYRKPDHGL